MIFGDCEGLHVILEIGSVGAFSIVVLILRDFREEMRSFGIPIEQFKKIKGRPHIYQT